MNKEELKLLEKIVNLPKELNIEIRGLILAEVVLREENQELKEQVEYLRRSVERKEEIILDLRNENTLHSDEYVSNLEKENQQLKEKLEASEKARKEALSMINSKEYVIDFSTFGYELNNYEIFKLKNILDIDKGEMKDE